MSYKFNIGDIISDFSTLELYLIRNVMYDNIYGFMYLVQEIKGTGHTLLSSMDVDMVSTIFMSSPKVYAGPLTQEEIDEIIESYNNSVPGIIPQNTGVGSPSNISFEYDDEDTLIIGDVIIGDGWHELEKEFQYNVAPPACRHKWKKYVGLSQSFEYCEICDKKKDDV